MRIRRTELRCSVDAARAAEGVGPYYIVSHKTLHLFKNDVSLLQRGEHNMKNKEIYLEAEEQEYLRNVVKVGVHNAHEITRARVLLMLDRSGKTDHVRYKRIAENASISVQAVYNMRDEFLENHDLQSYLTRKKRETPARKPKLDGKSEAQIIALACSKPPEGYARWSIRLLAAKAVELHYVDELSYSTVNRLLKKRNISLI